MAVSSYGSFTPERIKHLELIQSVVSRLANEAALIRGWALTVAAAIDGFAVRSLNWRIAAVGLLPTVVFWGLNAYYLRAERQFRAFYDRVRLADKSVEPFAMNGRDEPADSHIATALSSTLRYFYGAMVAVALVLVTAGLLHD
jgi:hypothetical protein